MQDITTLDWIWLFLQIALLAGLIVRELRKPRDRNLYAIFSAAALLVLVQGQAYWAFCQFDQNGGVEMKQLYCIVNVDGARLANFYIGLWTLCFIAAFTLSNPRKSSAVKTLSVDETGSTEPSVVTYALVGAWTFGSGLLLLALLGGLQNALDKPGESIGGQTVLLLALGLGKLLPLHKFSTRQKLNWFDAALFGWTLLLTLLNSRMMAAFALCQAALLFSYRRSEVSRRVLAGLALGLIMIFIYFGLYREYSTVKDRVGEQAFQSFVGRFGVEGALNWFYRGNVEGFTGVAGMMTYASYNNGLAHDGGISLLQLFTQFIPYDLRHNAALPFDDMAQYLRDAYPYPDSVVSPGMECAYAYWGLPGLLGFGAALGYLVRWLHVRGQSRQPGDWRVVLLSIYLFQFIRGTFVNALFFMIGELVVLQIYHLMLEAGRDLSRGRQPVRRLAD